MLRPKDIKTANLQSNFSPIGTGHTRYHYTLDTNKLNYNQSESMLLWNVMDININVIGNNIQIHQSNIQAIDNNIQYHCEIISGKC